MSKKVWIIFASVCVLLLAGLVIISNSNRVNVDDVDNDVVLGPSEQSGNIGDHVFGKVDSPVVLVEYGDFQCPGCGSAYPTIKKVTEKYEQQLAFVFRNFPLTSIHPNARAASAAAEAAGNQGKFWDMYALLFENQATWEALNASERTDFFAGYAEQIGLETEAFADDMASSSVSQKINFDLALGKKFGVDSTPTFFLNGERLDKEVWQDETALEAKIIDALQAAGVELPDEE